MKKKLLAAKVALVVIMTASAVQPAQAGIPVIDGTNLTQNIALALDAASQTVKQIQQYRTQLE